MSPMANLNGYDFKIVNGKMRPLLEDSFLDKCVSECYKSKPAHNRDKILHKILSAICENADLDKTITERFQHLMIIKQED